MANAISRIQHSNQLYPASSEVLHDRPVWRAPFETTMLQSDFNETE